MLGMIGGGGARVCVCVRGSVLLEQSMLTLSWCFINLETSAGFYRTLIGDCFMSDWQQERIPPFTPNSPPPLIFDTATAPSESPWLLIWPHHKQKRVEMCAFHQSAIILARGQTVRLKAVSFTAKGLFFPFSARQQLHSHARNHASCYNGSVCVQPHIRAFKTGKSPKESSKQVISVPGNSLTAFQNHKCDLLFTYIWRGLISFYFNVYCTIKLVYTEHV